MEKRLFTYGNHEHIVYFITDSVERRTWLRGVDLTDILSCPDPEQVFDDIDVRFKRTYEELLSTNTVEAHRQHWHPDTIFIDPDGIINYLHIERDDAVAKALLMWLLFNIIRSLKTRNKELTERLVNVERAIKAGQLGETSTDKRDRTLNKECYIVW